MKITVTPECRPTPGHPDFYDHGTSYTGSHLIVSSAGVWLDGYVVLMRDRRMKKNRTADHPWIEVSKDGLWLKFWTTFSVEVEP